MRSRKIPHMGAARVYAEFGQFEPAGQWLCVAEQLRRGTESGIILPDLKHNTTGLVLKAGPEARAAGIRGGDRVAYREWQGGRWVFSDAAAESGQTACLIMSVDDVLAIIREE